MGLSYLKNRVYINTAFLKYLLRGWLNIARVSVLKPLNSDINKVKSY